MYFIFITKMSGADNFRAYHTTILDAIQKSGAAISHHHGIGKMFAPWLEGSLGQTEYGVFKVLKDYFDKDYLMNPGGTLGSDLEPENFIPPYDSILPGHYTPEVEIFWSGGDWLISWFKKEFAQKEVAEAIEKKVQPEAKGAVIGLSDMHTRIHLYRAIIEGINFALMDGMRHMEKRGGFRFEEIRVGGEVRRAVKSARLQRMCLGFLWSEHRPMKCRESGAQYRLL